MESWRGHHPEAGFQDYGKKVEKATTPFQCALSFRTGCEYIAHAIQAKPDVKHQFTESHVEWSCAAHGERRHCVAICVQFTLQHSATHEQAIVAQAISVKEEGKSPNERVEEAKA